MPENFNAVPFDITAVEFAIRQVERETRWFIPLPARTVIHQLFASLAMDQGGFAIPMSQSARKEALQIAQKELPGFLFGLVKKSMNLAKRSGYEGNEVGFPVVVHEMDSWAARISCSCWPH